MRHFVILLAWLCAACFPVRSAFAEIEYHFVPAMNGQPTGCAQFVNVAPVVGPQNFEVTLAGSRVGCTPGVAPQDAKAYLDKWGLGVFNPQAGNDKGIVGQVELDGKNGGEYLRLEFPTSVRLTYLTFASVGSEDRFSLLGDNIAYDIFGDKTIMQISQEQNPGGKYPGHVEFPTEPPFRFAKVWDVVITTPGSGIQLENVGVMAVPEPSTLVLWLAGLAFVGISLTRRSIRSRSA